MFVLDETCVLSDRRTGVCRQLSQCNSLTSLYEKDKSRQVINLLLAAQRSCKSKAVGRNPIVCCLNDGQTTSPQEITDCPVLNSNQMCSSKNRSVCCPLNNSTTDVGAKFSCGLSKITHKRVFYGPAKLGNFFNQ